MPEDVLEKLKGCKNPGEGVETSYSPPVLSLLPLENPGEGVETLSSSPTASVPSKNPGEGVETSATTTSGSSRWGCESRRGS